MQLAYHGCENLTHTSKTRHVKCTQMAVTVRFTIRMFLTFSTGKNRAQLNCRVKRCEV